MAEVFKLPISSFEEVTKLIKAYSSEKEGVTLSLDDISQSTGVPRTVVSGNNGFLTQIGIITDGNKKAATEIGRALGRAYISKIDYEIERIWKDIIAENDFMSRMISAVRIRNGMDRTSLINHIVYSSGQKDTKQNRAGAGAIIEILRNVNVLNDEDGKMSIVESTQNETKEVSNNIIKEDTDQGEKNIVPTKIVSTKNGVQINININCNVGEIDELSEKLRNLLSIVGDNN